MVDHARVEGLLAQRLGQAGIAGHAARRDREHAVDVRHRDRDARFVEIVVLHRDATLAVDADLVDETVVGRDVDHAAGDQPVLQAFRDVLHRDRLGVHVPALQPHDAQEVDRNRVVVLVGLVQLHHDRVRQQAAGGEGRRRLVPGADGHVARLQDIAIGVGFHVLGRIGDRCRHRRIRAWQVDHRRQRRRIGRRLEHGAVAEPVGAVHRQTTYPDHQHEPEETPDRSATELVADETGNTQTRHHTYTLRHHEMALLSTGFAARF